MNEVSYITAIDRIDKKKSVVTVDEAFKFSLYQSELKKYDIYEGARFTEEQRKLIFHELLPGRARQRVLYMLRDSDKSESDIRTKLMESYYPLDIIESVVAYMKDLNYIDDNRYTRQYILTKCKGKSLNMIRQELRYHGISTDIIDACFLELEEDVSFDEYQSGLIRKEFLKRRYDFTQENQELKNKIISSLMRKGFQLEDIMKVYRKMTEEN
jgi:regulatory protein